MGAYVIADAEIFDPAKYAQYENLSLQAIERHGGRMLASGGQTALLEGGRRPGRVAIIEFPSLEAARSFYTSIEYTSARRARGGAARIEMIAVESL